MQKINKKSFLIFLSLIKTIIFSLFIFTSCNKQEQVHNKTETPDLSKHPIYSKYQFGNEDNIIDFGGQPLGVPIGVVSEVMMHDMILKEELSRLNYKLRFHSFFKGDDVNYFMKRGDLEVAMGGDMPAITLASDQNIIITSLVKLDFSSIISKKYRMLSELKGKRIGYPFGSNAHYALLRGLFSAGINKEEVTLIKLNVNEMAKKLNQGEIDAFTTWEPFTTIHLNRYPDFKLMHKSLSAEYLYMLRSFSDKHPEAVRQILASQIRAMQWMVASDKNLLKASLWNINRRKELNTNTLRISKEIISDLTYKGILEISPSPIIPLNDIDKNGPIQNEFEFLKNIKMISSSVNWNRVFNSFDRSIIKEIMADQFKFRTYEFNYSDTEISGE